MEIYICAIIKNEHKDLKEWIDYHFNLGVTRIVLFEDGGQSHKDIIDSYGNKIIFIPLKEEPNKSKHKVRQQLCYEQWFKKMNVGDWCFFIDADEFLHFELSFYNIKELMHAMECEGISDMPIFWEMYGANGQWKRGDGGVVDTFRYPLSDDINLKTILRHDSKCFVHKMEGDNEKFESCHHKTHRTENEYKFLKSQYYGKVRLRHYYTKSYEDWCNKKARGGFLEPNKKSNDDIFWQLNPEMLIEGQKAAQGLITIEGITFKQE